jgi:glycosidase
LHKFATGEAVRTAAANVALAAAVLSLAGAALAKPARPQTPHRPATASERLPEDEVVYFLLPDRFSNGDPSNDRGGLSGGPLQTGFDPANKRFYLGGDLKGLTSKLDYIQGLGATAIWVAPIFKNKPVQVADWGAMAGYHGYWITDFTDVDPHFGTRADFAALVAAAHARGLKVYMDIVTNHTADVIKYRECHDPEYTGPDKVGPSCPYRSKADYPYTRRGGVNGEPINRGFLGDDEAHQTTQNFEKLTRDDYAYTPYIPAGEEHEKKPEWLNDPHFYHNRGNTTFHGEDSLYGDFGGLDDLMTEDPRVVQGFIDIYTKWIADFRVDGFRIDTVKHVNASFWRRFVPAMQAAARKAGIDHFRIFGEAYYFDPAELARITWDTDMPAVLDFALQGRAREAIGGKVGTSGLADLFGTDSIYRGGAAGARAMPTFISNHDMGRFAWQLSADAPQMSDQEVMKRVTLGYALIMFARGTPVIYSGDEQGFVGHGNDNDARQPLFASKVASYNDQRLLGTGSTTAVDNYDTRHPLYLAIGGMADLRREHPALRRGEMIVRVAGDKPGLFVFERVDPTTGNEVLVALNTSTEPLTARSEVDARSRAWASLHGRCSAQADAPGSLSVTVPPLDYIVCEAKPEPTAP